METQAHFEDIPHHIKKVLQEARYSLSLAVAWFTDPELYNELVRLAREGCEVEVLLTSDDINQGPYGLDFSRLRFCLHQSAGLVLTIIIVNLISMS